MVYLLIGTAAFGNYILAQFGPITYFRALPE
jgi:hypothetical protein